MPFMMYWRRLDVPWSVEDEESHVSDSQEWPESLTGRESCGCLQDTGTEISDKKQLNTAQRKTSLRHPGRCCRLVFLLPVREKDSQIPLKPALM